jgi:ATP-binding cassette subfamily B protein
MRALLHNNAILIFDEATSNLDSETEEAILGLIKDARKDKTTIIVGHRISTVALADKIIVLDGGEIVESGSFRELLDKKNYFYKLFRAQIEAR